MFRPAYNKKTRSIDTIDIETCPNLEDYDIVKLSEEANQDSLSVNGEKIDQESPTRKIALQQDADYENKLINEAIAKNKSKK